MDELGQLCKFRSDVPRRDADLSRAQSALDEAIEAETSRAGKPRARGSRLFPRPRFALAGAAAALAAVVLAIAFLPADRGGPNAAVAALERVAVVAGNQPAESPPGPGQYLYTKSVTQAGPEIVVLPGSPVPPPGSPADPFEDPNIIHNKEAARAGLPKYTAQVWAAPDGNSGRSVEVLDGIFGFPGVPIDEQARREAWEFRCDRPLGCWPGAGSGVVSRSYTMRLGTEVVKGGPGTASGLAMGAIYSDLSGLPTDPDELREEIETGGLRDLIYLAVHKGGRDVETFDIVGQLLSTPGNFAPPEVRQALYEVVAQLEGVELVGQGVTDPVHRSGVAVALTNNGIRRELIFDPNTAQLLAQRDVMADPDAVETEFSRYELEAEPGTLISYTAYLSSGVVDSIHETLGPNPPTAPPPTAVPPGAEPPPR